jgi:hypothetical protein
MDQDSRSYYERRERSERAAAKSATNAEARRAHQALAQNYAALMDGRLAAVPQSEDGNAPSRLTVIGL